MNSTKVRGSETQPHVEAPDNLHIGDVIVSTPKLALGQLVQIQVIDTASDKILKSYIYIKSSRGIYASSFTNVRFLN